MTNNRTRGFTLLELSLVTLLISLLAFVSYGWYRTEIDRANVAELIGTIDAMRTAFAVENSSGAEIPDFGAGKVGTIPPQLSNLALHPDMMSYPNLNLLFTYQYLDASDHHAFLALLSKNERGADSLRAMAASMPPEHFIWIMEPIAALVPMLDEVHTTHLIPTPAVVTGLPKPVQVTTTSLAKPPVAQPPVAQPPVAQPAGTAPVVAVPPNTVPATAMQNLPAQSGSGGSGSSSSSSSSSGTSNPKPAVQWVPPGLQSNCHNHGNSHGNGHGNSHSHGHGHAYGHC